MHVHAASVVLAWDQNRRKSARLKNAVCNEFCAHKNVLNFAALFIARAYKALVRRCNTEFHHKFVQQQMHSPKDRYKCKKVISFIIMKFSRVHFSYFASVDELNTRSHKTLLSVNTWRSEAHFYRFSGYWHTSQPSMSPFSFNSHTIFLNLPLRIIITSHSKSDVRMLSFHTKCFVIRANRRKFLICTCNVCNCS